MKLFSYIANGVFGKISCGVVIAESIEKAKILLETEFDTEDIKSVTEIPLTEGITEIDNYYE